LGRGKKEKAVTTTISQRGRKGTEREGTNLGRAQHAHFGFSSFSFSTGLKVCLNTRHDLCSPGRRGILCGNILREFVLFSERWHFVLVGKDGNHVDLLNQKTIKQQSRWASPSPFGWVQHPTCFFPL
jgi:hypothetical protein